MKKLLLLSPVLLGGCSYLEQVGVTSPPAHVVSCLWEIAKWLWLVFEPVITTVF